MIKLWHFLRMKYFNVLLNSALSMKLRKKIIKGLKYHSEKYNEELKKESK